MVYFKFKQMLPYVEKNYQDLVLTSLEKARIVVTGEYTKDDYHESHEVIIIPYTGYNKIDVSFINEKGIRLFNTTTHSKYVAERALALTLSLMGKILVLHQKIVKGIWADPTKKVRDSWDSLYDLKIGFLGYGSISQALKPLLEPFTKHFYTIDRNKTYEGVQLVKDLEALVDVSDVLYIATPLTPQTEGLIGKAMLSKMKNTFLINVGRGPIVDEDVLYESLKNHTLKGFASDVWFRYPEDGETLTPSKYDLSVFDNVVMTPHNASFTEHALNERYEKVIKTIFNVQNHNYEEALDLTKILSYEVLK